MPPGVLLTLRAAIGREVIAWAADRFPNAWEWFASRAIEGSPRLKGIWAAGIEEFSKWPTKKAVQEGYEFSYAYYAAVSTLAEDIRSVPWQVMRAERDGDVVVDSGPLVDLIRNPNPDMSWGELMEAWTIYKYLTGDGYGHITPDVECIWYLRNDRMSVDLDSMGHIENYVYTIESQKTLIPPEEMAHFKFFNPADDYFGLPPLKAAAGLVDTSNELVKWNRDSLVGRAVPDMIFSPKNPMSKQAHKAAVESLEKTLAKNGRKALFPADPLDILPMSLTPIEMDFIKSFETYEDAIAMVLHIHPEALGKEGTFQNKEWAIRAKWEGPVTGRLRETRETLNKALAPKYGTAFPAAPGQIFIDYDMANTPGAQAQRVEAEDRATKLWAIGYPANLLDKKLGLGLGPIEGGDVGYLPVQVLPAGFEQEVVEPERMVRQLNLDVDNEASMRRYWQTINRKKVGWERGVTRKVAQEFAKEGRVVTAAIRNGLRDTDALIGSRSDEWDALITAVMRGVIEDFGGLIAEDIEGVERAVPNMGTIIPELGMRQEEFDPWTEAIRRFVRTRTAEHVASIVKTTQEAIRADVLAGLDAGESSVKIAKRVGETFEKWEKGIGTQRSLLIARTEVHTASSYGMIEAARQSGVVEEKAWLSAFDPPRAREMHMDVSLQYIPLEEAFVMADGASLMQPGDGPADHVILCRCVLLFKTR